MNEMTIQDGDATQASPSQQDELRAICRGIIERDGTSQSALAKQFGIPSATFSAWFNATYAGNNEQVAAKVVIGLETLEERERAAAMLPPDVGFLDTPTAKRIISHLRFAHYAPAIVVVAMGAGCGKTMTCRQYARSNANVWMATAEPCAATVYPMLSTIAEALGIEEKVQTRLSGAIRKFTAGKGGLLIVDEAQHLDTKALDQLRSIPDAVDIGLALVGNERVYSRLEGGGRSAEFAQLFSRVGKTITQARPRSTDVNALIKAWGVEGADEKKLLRLIGSKPGALRAVSMTLRSAAMMAGGADRIDFEALKTAWEELSHQVVSSS